VGISEFSLTFSLLIFTMEVMRTGRPPKAKDQLLNEPMKVMVTTAQRDLIDSALRLEGCEFSEWARAILVQAAEKLVNQARNRKKDAES
jgi:uncharacterized protein (DUF1778 family)